MGCLNSTEKPGNQNGKSYLPHPETGEIRPNIQLPEVPEETVNIPIDVIIVEALFDYLRRYDDELSFQKGDRIVVIGDSVTEWWLGRLQQTGEEGYFPANYVKRCDRTPKSIEAWFDEPRREVDKKLLRPGNPTGTYIVRPSQEALCYALSIRYYNSKTKIFEVKHYKIKTLDNDRGFYINPKVSFSSCQELVDHYSASSDGLCCKLLRPCPRTYVPPAGFREMIQPAAAFSFIKKLGQGAFGEVHLGKWNKSVDVAIKKLKPGQMSTDEFLGEAKLMHKLNHRNILLLMAVCSENDNLMIITEYMCNGALLQYLRNDEGKKIKKEELIDMAAQISSGMEYLEQNNYVHRDLRAANILVGNLNLVKVADFGLAKMVVNEPSIEQGTRFPIRWTAPEAFEGMKFSTKSDVWSFGVLLYEMFTYGRIPYAGFENHRTVITEVRRGYRMEIPENCPKPVYGKMTHCWAAQPDNRPTFISLREFFDDYCTASERQYGN